MISMINCSLYHYDEIFHIGRKMKDRTKGLLQHSFAR